VISVPATPGLEDESSIDKAVQLYREFGYSDERIARLLIRTAYSAAAVQTRFPQIDISQFPGPTSRGAGGSTREPEEQIAKPVAPRGNIVPIGRAGAAIPSVLNRLAAAKAATEVGAEEEGAQANTSGLGKGLSYQYVPLIQCTFPHADPGEQTIFARHNGWLEVSLSTARPDKGLPYGVPARLLTIFCASEAVRTNSPEIELGDSMHAFLRRLDVPISRGERGSLRLYANQLLRLAYCSISVEEDVVDVAGRVGIHIKPTFFFKDTRLWWDEGFTVGQGSSLTLSPDLYESMREKSAPLSTRALRRLRNSPMDLDIYAWLVHRLFRLAKPSLVTWEQLFGQIGHTYSEIRYFRRFFNLSLKRVLCEYPEARLKVSEKGVLLLPSKPHIDPRFGVLA
jgi:hypothetical protein